MDSTCPHGTIYLPREMMVTSEMSWGGVGLLDVKTASSTRSAR